MYGGPTDPILRFSSADDEWLLFYTQRRATLGLPGTEWVHGTSIAVAASGDQGRSWRYRGPLKSLHVNDLPRHHQTHWAPDIIRIDGIWTMFLTIVEGIYSDWSGVAALHQFESTNLRTWKWTGRIELDSDRVIDAAVALTPDGRYRLWYKDENRGSTTHVAVSDTPRNPDSWRIERQAVGGRAHEGPTVFSLGGWWWMIVDEWRGLAVHRSIDGIHGWERQRSRGGLIGDRVWTASGHRSLAHHADAIVLPPDKDGPLGALVYFSHDPTAENEHRSTVAVASLRVHDDELLCSLDGRF